MSNGGGAVLVTGGAGFIGSHLVERLVAAGRAVVVLDALTYAGRREHLAAVADRIVFVHGDICDATLVARLLAQHSVDAVINCAAESHVDRSIAAPAPFVATNVVGTERLLSAALEHWRGLAAPAREAFRFLQVSTDEVFGSIEHGSCDETSPYRPSSPYAASKAAADHLALAWARTFGLPVLLTHGCNTYGPRQYPEKLLPRLMVAALEGKPLPIYGDGQQQRDWLHVEDHAEGITFALTHGRPGSRYCLGAGNESRNLELVRKLCGLLDAMAPRADGLPHASSVAHVEDRQGHDRRYAMDCSLAVRELGFRPSRDFSAGLAATVRWYLDKRTA